MRTVAPRVYLSGYSARAIGKKPLRKISIYGRYKLFDQTVCMAKRREAASH
jgi:hypothetical protein